MAITGNNVLVGASGGGRAAMSDAPQTSLEHHYRADTGVTVATGVSSWEDQNGSADFAQATTADQPAYSDTSGANGLEGFTFDGVDDWITTASIAVQQPAHVFMVASQVTWTAEDHIWAGIDGAGGHGNQFTQDYYSSSPGVGIAMNTLPICKNNDFILDTFFLWDVLLDGASSHITANAGTPSTGTGQADFDFRFGMTLGANGAGDGRWSNIIVSELLLYSAEITGSPLTSLQTYLNDQYELW